MSDQLGDALWLPREVLVSSRDDQDHGSRRLHADYLEIMDFLNDAIISMDAFVGAYKHAAVFFSCPIEMRMASFREKSIDKWQRKTQLTTGAVAMKGKFQAFNQRIWVTEIVDAPMSCV